MSWYGWIFISIVTTAVANLLQRVVMKEKESDPLVTAIIFQFAVGLLTGIFAVWKGFVFPPIGAFFWNFLLSTLLWGLGSYFLFKTYQFLGSSEVAIISSFGTIVTIGTSVLFLGESFNVPKAIGTVLIISSIVIISKKKGRFTFGQGSLYAVITTIFYGLAVANDAFVLRTYDAVSYTSVISILPGVLLLLIQPSVIYRFKKLTNPIFGKSMLLLALFYSIQAVAYYVALQNGANASQISPIYKSNIILTVLLATIFLKEKEHIPLKIFSAVLVTAGVLLIV